MAWALARSPVSLVVRGLATYPGGRPPRRPSPDCARGVARRGFTMVRQFVRGLGPAFGWLVFPVIPALLGRAYHETFNLAIFFQKTGPDPRAWGWFAWLILTGPLVGYGFLA